MSALKTEEDLVDDSYEEYFNEDGLRVVPGYHTGPFAEITDTVVVYPGMIPRPADQRFSFSMLFQDEMPRNPDYKVLLSLFFGTGLFMDRHPSTVTKTSSARLRIGGSMSVFLGHCTAMTPHEMGLFPLKCSTCSASTTPSTTTGFKTSMGGTMRSPTF